MTQPHISLISIHFDREQTEDKHGQRPLYVTAKLAILADSAPHKMVLDVSFKTEIPQDLSVLEWQRWIAGLVRDRLASALSDSPSAPG
jgi:hypothetical protein